ncbi:MAG: PepSY domain-containing protein, partial [Candidatus Micrarchaeia archaeon]
SAEIKTALKYQEQALISTQSNKEIKVSPSVAIEAVPAQAQIKNIELIDDGTAPAYRIHAVSNRRRMFFLIPVEMEINYKIDATNGKVLSEEKPWWSFLVWG